MQSMLSQAPVSVHASLAEEYHWVQAQPSILMCCLKQMAAHLHRCMKASICANTALLSIFQGLPPPLATALAVRW